MEGEEALAAVEISTFQLRTFLETESMVVTLVDVAPGLFLAAVLLHGRSRLLYMFMPLPVLIAAAWWSRVGRVMGTALS